MFISLEGGEGSGKSTILKEILKYFEENNISYLATREPGGTKISEQIRAVILDNSNTEMSPLTEAMLYAASRCQLLNEKIIPALNEGKVVISDRFVDSSIIYQGIGRGLGTSVVYEINKPILSRMPDLTLFFDITPEEGFERIFKNKDREVNRLDLESLEFHKKNYNGFKDLANSNKERIVIIDASKDITTVAKSAIKVIKERMQK